MNAHPIYDALFNKSIDLDFKVFSDEHDYHHVIESYREKFAKSKSKFCTLNATAMLEDKE